MLGKSFYNLFSYVLLVVPTLFAVWWSVYPAAVTWVASQQIQTINKNELGNQLKIRRKLQKYFSRYKVYVPFEDIIIQKGKLSKNSILRKVCGNGNVFILLPIKFRLPYVGYKIFEWCFKPAVM